MDADAFSLMASRYLRSYDRAYLARTSRWCHRRMRESRGQHRRWVWHLAHAGGDGDPGEDALRDILRWWPQGGERLLMHCFASLGLLRGMQLLCGGATEWSTEIRMQDLLPYSDYNGFGPLVGICETAARYNQLGALRMAIIGGCVHDKGTLYKAVLHGATRCVQYLHEECKIKWFHQCTNVALGSGSMECVQYVQTSGYGWTDESTAYAAESGVVDLLRLVRDEGCPWHKTTTACAASRGHLDILRFAIEHGCPWSEDTTAVAARAGHLGVLRFAAEHGCPWHVRTTMEVAREGHIEALRCVIEHGCPWHKDTTARAAARGHLDILRFAIEHGCPWSKDTTTWAVLGHLDVLRFVVEHGCPWSDETTSTAAAKKGWLECLQYAHEHGCPWSGSTTSVAATWGNIDALRFAHGHGCPWADTTTLVAARNGQLDILRFAVEHGCPVHPLTAHEAVTSVRPTARACLMLLFSQGAPMGSAVHVLAVARWGEGWERGAAVGEP